jgi:hypothetical protein
MLHYASGAPSNDDFQVVENQLARQRLFSVHPTHSKPLWRWVDDLHAGVHSFRDQLKRTPSLSGKLARADDRMLAELAERGHDPAVWVPYEDALLALSDRLGPGYPRRIMLDSGAFTDWNKGRSSEVSDVVRSYRDFLDHAGDLFDEVFLINLDVIPEVDDADDVKAVAAAREQISDGRGVEAIKGVKVRAVRAADPANGLTVRIDIAVRFHDTLGDHGGLPRPGDAAQFKPQLQRRGVKERQLRGRVLHGDAFNLWLRSATRQNLSPLSELGQWCVFHPFEQAMPVGRIVGRKLLKSAF